MSDEIDVDITDNESRAVALTRELSQALMRTQTHCDSVLAFAQQATATVALLTDENARLRKSVRDAEAERERGYQAARIGKLVRDETGRVTHIVDLQLVETPETVEPVDEPTPDVDARSRPRTRRDRHWYSRYQEKAS